MKIPELDVVYTDRLCFACGEDNPIGLKLQPIYDGEKVIAEFTAGKFHQGWNNTIHGGILYTLFDEVSAYAMLCHGIDFGVTARSEIKFKQIAPTDEPIHISAWITRLTKRLVETRGVLSLRDNSTIAEGTSLFYIWRRSKKTVLWDMDGVIADSYSFHFAAWQETFAKRGATLSKDDYVKLFGSTNDLIIHSVLGKEISQKDIIAIAQEKEETFRYKAQGNIKPFPGVIKLLNMIKNGNFKMALVSSAPKENIDFIISELNLETFFDCIISGQDVPAGKVSPQIYLLAAEKLEVEPTDCIVIEDFPAGIEAAKSTGMRCLAVTNFHPEKEVKQADKVVGSLEGIDLITLIQKI